MIKKLQPVTGKNRFCGPTAIAAITGITTDQASRIIRTINGKRSITSVSYEHLVDALVFLGCHAQLFAVEGKPTANQWISNNGKLFADQFVILVHGCHYGTLLDGQYICSLSERVVVPAHGIPKKKARVAAYIVVGNVNFERVAAVKHTQPNYPEMSVDQLRPRHELGRLQDDPEAKCRPSGRSIPLSEEQYKGFERAMQWPEDLPAYDLAQIKGGRASQTTVNG